MDKNQIVDLLNRFKNEEIMHRRCIRKIKKNFLMEI